MTLKQLISIKFMVYIAASAGLAYLSFHTFTYYRNLEHDNQILYRQNELYRQMLSIDAANKKEREKIDSELKIYSRSRYNKQPAESDDDRIFWFLGYIVIIMSILRFIDEKIEKKKFEVNDRGDML